jgi:hypothetical protein
MAGGDYELKLRKEAENFGILFGRTRSSTFSTAKS